MMAGGGAANNLLAMAEFQGKLVAGGDFHQSTAHLPVAHHIVAWDGLKLTAFGSGMDGPVNALKTVSSTELVAGGTFTRAGGRTVSNIARWAPDPRDPLVTRWQPMGSGFNSGVFALERYNNITHAGGGFTTSGSTVVNSVARFNEGTGSWLALGGGMNGTVYALKEYNGALYAGGTFTTAGGIATGGLARWNGVSWNQVGGYFQGFVFALEVHDDKLVIGGQYPGINSSPNLARYDGLGYSTFATGGTNSTVRALRSVAGRLYIGGYFTAAGTVAASRVAYWDGSWHDASGGADNYVFALGGYHDEVQVGGMFQSVDQGSLSSPTWARYVDSGLPWFASQPVSRTIMLGDDVSFTAQAASGFPGLSYRWHHNGAPLFDGPTGGGSSISGATTQTVSVSDAVWTDHGTYQLVASNPCGSVSSNPATLEFTGTTGVSPETGRITAFESLGPNPSGGSSQLAYSLASDASVRIRVHDVRGRLVRRWEAGHLPAGRHRAIWDAKDDAGARVAAGAYFVGLEVDGHTVGTRRLTILR
jgi:hypothetical protein